MVAWVSGTCAKLFKSEVQFGHAGAKSGGLAESAQVTRRHLAGAEEKCLQPRGLAKHPQSSSWSTTCLQYCPRRLVPYRSR